MSLDQTIPVQVPGLTSGRSLWRRVLKKPFGLTSAIVLLLIVIVGLLAPVLAPYPPNLARLELTNAPPFGPEYFLGGDQSGRDILSRLLFATIGTLQGSVVLLIVSLALGVTGGLVAGYFGGRIDSALSWGANILLTLPGFVLLIALYALTPNITILMGILGVLVAPGYFWLVRASTMAVRNELYVDAARVAGLSDRRIISRHILRAVRGPVIVQSAFILAAGIGIQAGLEFLGLGDPASVSWGGMLNSAFANLYVAPVNLVWPAAIIGVTTLSLVLLGNALRDVLQMSGARHGALPRSVVRRIQAESRAAQPEIQTHRPQEDVLLQVRGLAVAYPDSAETVQEVVHGVDLQIRRGEVHGLVGESGSGKSQIAFSILGILPREAVITRGEVLFEGRDLLSDRAALRAARGRRIAYVPQEPMTNLDPSFTIGQQLTYGIRAAKHLSRAQARVELLALLDRVGIREPARVFDLYPHQVSGGMAQRVLIAGALAGDPELLIADEPTTALDVTVQADVLDLLRGLQRERHLAMLLVTHNLGVVADLCDRVSVMQSGRIVESQPVLDLFSDPHDDYTRTLLGSTLDDAPLRTAVSFAGGAQ